MGKLRVTAEPNSPFITMTREFNAPADKVFKAYTDPEVVKMWFGGHKAETKVETYDARRGGSWRMVQKGDDGEYAFRGVFHEVKPNDHITWTFEYEGVPDHVCLETISFTEKDGKTQLKTQSVFQSVEDRDGMVQSGMEEGANEGMDILAELVEN
ncbi:MAG TPA: SRPBCC family protein [Candidatus Limnocylindria bacterium]|nr:SRPBCC family protein [Candidatus Limnocylindria bacterium]